MDLEFIFITEVKYRRSGLMRNFRDLVFLPRVFL